MIMIQLFVNYIRSYFWDIFVVPEKFLTSSDSKECLLTSSSPNRRNYSNNETNFSVEVDKSDSKCKNFEEDIIDGGIRAWIVAFASFLCQGVLGIVFCYAVLYDEIHTKWKEDDITNASGKAALVGSLAVGILFLTSPISGILTEIIGLRATIFLGSLISSVGMFLSSFCEHSVIGLTFSYSFLLGFGGALTYSPSLAVLGLYFKKYLGLVNGIVMAGSAAFSIIMPYLVTTLLTNFGFEWTLKLMGLLSGTIMLISIFFDSKPTVTTETKVEEESCWESITDFSVFKNLKFLLWCISTNVGALGCMIPYIYISDFAQTNFGDHVDKTLPIVLIGISSLFGRLVFGALGDTIKRLNRITLQQISLLGSGMCLILFPYIKSFSLLNFFVILFGFCDGGFLSVLPPVVFEICGSKHAVKAIGFAFGLLAIPTTLGPFIAGIILEKTSSYTLPFISSGIASIVAFFLMMPIKCARNNNNE